MAAKVSTLVSLTSVPTPYRVHLTNHVVARFDE